MRENVERVGAVDIDRNIDGSGECVYTVYCQEAEACGWRPARDGYGTHDIAEARVLAEAHMTMRHTCDFRGCDAHAGWRLESGTELCDYHFYTAGRVVVGS